MHAPGDELEARLNAALREYADPAEDPQPAVLAARVFAAAEKNKRIDWLWVGRGLRPALAGLLVLSIAAVFSARWKPLPPRIAFAPPTPQRVYSMAMLPPAKVSLPLVSHRVARSRTYRPPKLDQFPQPQPLSEQERLVYAFVSTASAATQQVVAQAAEPPEFISMAQPQEHASETATPNANNTGAPHE